MENDKQSLATSISNLSVMAEKAAKDGNVKLCVDYFNDHLEFLDKIIELINENPSKYQYLFKGDESVRDNSKPYKIYYSENSIIGIYITTFRASLHGNIEVAIYAASSLNRFLRLLLSKISSIDQSDTLIRPFQITEYQELIVQTLRALYSLNSEVNRNRIEIISLQSYVTDGWYYMLFSFPDLNNDYIENQFSYYFIQNIQENIKNDALRHFGEFLDYLISGSFRYSVGGGRKFEIRNILQEAFPGSLRILRAFESCSKIVSRRTYLVWESEFDQVISQVTHEENEKTKNAIIQAKRYAVNEQRIGTLRLNIIHIGAYCIKENKYKFLNAMLNNFSPRTNTSYSANEDILPNRFDLGFYIINMFDVVSYDEFGWGRMDKDVFIYRFLICLLFKEEDVRYIFNIKDLKTDELSNLIYRVYSKKI